MTAKLWSWVTLPAKCRDCGKLCFAPNSPGGVLLVTNILILTAAGFLAAYLYTPAPLVVGAALAVTLWLLRLHIQPLIALSTEQVAEARKREGFWLFVIVLLGALR